MARDYVLRLIEQIGTMLEALLSRREAAGIIAAREDLENTCVRMIGFTLTEVKGLSPEEVVKILERSGALRIARAVTLAELLLLDAQWHQSDRSPEQLLPNYVHAVCLLADSVELLNSDEQPHFRARMAAAADKLGELRNHPYIRERLARYESAGSENPAAP